MDDKMRALAVMMSSTFKVLAIALTVNLLAALTYGQESKDKLLEDAKATFGIVSAPKQEELDKPIVELGRHLFWDERLSANGKIACASCHAASSWGADAERFSLDAKGKLTKRNSQTVFNSMLQSHLRWTGDRKSGAHQAEKSLTGSMGFTNADDVIALLKLHGYESRFEDAFPSIPGAMTPANYAKAIESYEATLGTPAPFDRYLNGQADALNEEQKQGLRLFMEVGCADCHSGKLLGGESLEKFGVHSEYWNATGSDAHDAGLFESTNIEEDRYRFRTSMLRNVEKTGPYFHDGSVSTLSDAVRVMAKVQLDKVFDSQQLQSIVAFLTSLTGEVPANYDHPRSASETSMSEPSSEFQLVQYGSMHETIGMQNHQGRVILGELIGRPNFYGVGALEKLQGEITIIDSKPIVTSVIADGVLASRSDEASKLHATLLVGGEVAKWTSVTIPSELSGEALESFILLNAERLGIQTDRPFPFLIDGAFSKVRLHVIHGACPVHARTRNKPIPQGHQHFEHEFAKLDGQLLGIFARNAAGKLTHPGTSMHAHMVYSDKTAQQVTGHLEAFSVDASNTLRLPAK
jgi:cytochrome c peroxidase